MTGTLAQCTGPGDRRRLAEGLFITNAILFPLSLTAWGSAMGQPLMLSPLPISLAVSAPLIHGGLMDVAAAVLLVVSLALWKPVPILRYQAYAVVSWYWLLCIILSILASR